ncbi:MAG: sulfurtransferase [Desulfovibrio sp.]|nr:sulfurtransferase [Desulfovibrio sp.]
MNSSARQIPAAEARAFLDSIRLGSRTLLDVRQDFEYAEGHLPGATLIPLPELAERAGELDAALPVLVYCRSGKRSLAGANLLSGLGFQDVLSMQGGISAWDGAQAVGPLDLGLAALLAARTPQEVLERAWGMELALEEYYTTLAGAAAEAEAAALFKRLAGFEARHRRTLSEIWKRLGGGDESAFEDRARASVAPGILEGGLSASGYLGLLADPASSAEALDLSMAIEAQAMDLYLRRAKAEGAEEDADLRRTLVLLAEEEKAHLKVLAAFVNGRGRF